MISKLSRKLRFVFPDWSRLSQATSALRTPVILTSLVVITLVIGVRQMGTLQSLELGAFDQLIRWQPDEGPDPRLLVVAVTEEDIQIRQEPTLSDQTVSQLLEKLEQYQPRAIGLDIYRDIPIEPGHANLAKRFQQSDRIITVCKASTGVDAGISPPPGIPEDRVGFADMPVDPGGILRRSLLFVTPSAHPEATPYKFTHICNDSSTTLFSLDFQLVLRYLEAQGIQPENTPTGDLKLGSTVFRRLEKNAGGYKNVDAEGYQLLINYRSSDRAAQQVTLTEVLQGKLDPSWVKDRIVLIGYTATSKKDDFYTPYSGGKQDNQKMPGVVVHAQIISQILSAVLDQRPLFWYWTGWGEAIWIGGWCLVGGTLAWRFRHPLRFALIGGVALGGLLGVCFGLFTKGGWVPLVPPALGLMATAGSVVLVDRFNKAGYTKVIADGVKAIFKIDIDQEKRARQVAEVTETDYFRELQQQREELMKESSKPQQRDSEPHSQANAESTDDDYFQQLQQKAKDTRNTQD